MHTAESAHPTEIREKSVLLYLIKRLSRRLASLALLLQGTQLLLNMANNIASDLQKDEYKVIIIGALGVGKTSLLLRYVHNTFEDRISKFISEEKKSVVVNGREIVLHLWDTAGAMLCVCLLLLSILCVYTTRPPPL